MQEVEANWSSLEKETARNALNKAYEREISALLQTVRTEAGSISGLDDLWHLNDFLSARRHELDGKYDYSYSVLLFVLANLVKDGWLQMEELKSLHQDKLAKIAALARM
jgi:hypothetical protein